jgi:hypothetical protein
MIRLILSRHIEPEERDRILSSLGLELSSSQEEPGQAYFEVWMPPDPNDQTAIHYVDDLPTQECERCSCVDPKDSSAARTLRQCRAA